MNGDKQNTDARCESRQDPNLKKLENSLYCLSKKIYAAGEVCWEFVTKDNKKGDAKIFVTTYGYEDFFILGAEYNVYFDKAKDKET